MASNTDLTVPVYARLGTTECQLGTLTLHTEGEPSVDLQPAALDLASRVFPEIAGLSAAGEEEVS